jgi:hypothetical protein
MDKDKIKVDDLSDQGVELYAGILLLTQLLDAEKPIESAMWLKVKNMRDRWVGLLVE